MTDPTRDIPQFGALLGESIGAVPAASRPRFLARLERGAADRYRGWAAALPEHADALLACAASEEQIAIRVDALYPAIPSELAAIEAALPGAIATYFEVFDGLSIPRQLALQAAAERQGSQAWQALKRPGLPQAQADELDALTAMELESAERLEALLAQLSDEGAASPPGRNR